MTPDEEQLEAMKEDEAARLDEAHRAARAEQLLNDPLLAAAFAEVRDEFLKAWSDSPMRDVEGRERIYTMLRLLDRVKKILETHVRTGQMAGMQLETIRTRMKRLQESIKRRIGAA